eukprot:14635897-Alexandrium_andersonii.AAC.1
MSASLVGSEMCIRDRVGCGLGVHPSGRNGRRASRTASRAGEGQALYCRPVSYTHLTLPTICSV